jgi:hypothetical protein
LKGGTFRNVSSEGEGGILAEVTFPEGAENSAVGSAIHGGCCFSRLLRVGVGSRVCWEIEGSRENENGLTVKSKLLRNTPHSKRRRWLQGDDESKHTQPDTCFLQMSG